MAHVFSDQSEKDSSRKFPFGASTRAEYSCKQVHIRTSSKGFTLQEVYTVTKCNPNPNCRGDLEKEYPDGLIPDKGKSYVFRAQATLDISFQKDSPAPHVVVKNNTIDYGNAFVEEFADRRSWLQKLGDFFKNLFQINTVENLSFSKNSHQTTANPVSKTQEENEEPSTFRP
jgi:hypothetical protein